jgi:hypothetical protein
MGLIGGPWGLWEPYGFKWSESGGGQRAFQNHDRRFLLAIVIAK